MLQKRFRDFRAAQKNWAAIFKEILTSRCSKNDWQPWNFIFDAELEGFPSMLSTADLRMCPSTGRGNAKPSPQSSLTWWGVDAPVLHLRPWAPCSSRDFYSAEHISAMQRSGTRCFTTLLGKPCWKYNISIIFLIEAAGTLDQFRSLCTSVPENHTIYGINI